jgi:hypothetical protein
VVGVLVDYVCSILAGAVLKILKNTPVLKSIATGIEKADKLFTAKSQTASVVFSEDKATGSASIHDASSDGDSNG